MAPATKGLSLFNLSSKKDKASKASKKGEVEGGMVVKQDVAKAVEPTMDPKKALLLSDPKKQQATIKPAAEPIKDAKQMEEPMKMVFEPAKPAAVQPKPAAPTSKAVESAAPASRAPEPAAPASSKPAAEQQQKQQETPKKEELKMAAEKPAEAKAATITTTTTTSSSGPAPAAPTPVLALPAPVAAAVATPAAAPAAPAAALTAAAAVKEVTFQEPVRSTGGTPKEVPAAPKAPEAPKPAETSAAAPAAPAAPAAASFAKADALLPAAAPAPAPAPAPVRLPLAAEAAAKAAEKSAVARSAAQEAAQREAAAVAAAAFEAATKEAEAASIAAAAAAAAAVPSLEATSKKTSRKAAPQPLPEPTSTSRMHAEDARAAWQTRPRVPVRLLDSYVNFMVVGESGLGKTTFINNLVSSYVTTGKTHDGSSTSLADFQSDPDRLKTVLEPMEVREAGRRLHVTVQDMPGWADDINLVRFLRIMVNFILSQRAKDYELLAGGRALTESAMCGQLQNSITGCVYFLTPHRVKKVDLIMMSALSQLVTVIPVVAKADTMTDDELVTFRQEIRTRLAAPFKYVHSKTLAPLDFNRFAFDEGVMNALGLKDDMLPLAIITSNKHELVEDASLLSQLGLQTNPDKQVEQPVRLYKWGQAYALNREHSDLIVLKRLLLGDRVESLYAMLDESYKRYVAFCEQYEEAGRQLPLIVQDELACSAYLEYDDYSTAKSALDAAQQAMSSLMAENKVLMERLNSLEREKGVRYKSSSGAN
ncbi:Septin-domain-containing protein [Scenedesmus sp. NREL 46B-D3]|nr:Septin-domain-containing protein [Scenedesmus sp. NREL 46B-D3]